MALVEFLRVRKALIIFAVAVTIVVAFVDFSIGWGIGHTHHHVVHGPNGSTSASISLGAGDASDGDASGRLADHVGTIPLAIVFGIAGFLAILMATLFGASLNRENERGGFAFTKPIARERLALTYLAIDGAAVLAAYAYVVFLAFVTFAIFGLLGNVSTDSETFGLAAVQLGAAFMWFGMLQGATAWRVGLGGLFVGLSWPLFIVTLAMYGVAYFGPLFHGVIVAIDFFNPLGYAGFHAGQGDASYQSASGIGLGASIALTWFVGLVGCGVAVAGWKRIEV